MDLVSNFTSIDEDKLINYLKISYSENELNSLCRNLDLEKEDIFSKYVPFRQNCENFVDEVKRHGYFHRLFLLLQSEPFYRERLISTFPELNLSSPKNKEKLDSLTKRVQFTNNNKQHENLDHEEWIRNCKDNMVLILGKDSPEEYMQELEKIGENVNEMGYSPIFIKKQEEIDSISNEDKMLAYASLSRFIIIEKSYAAGQIDEAKICAINRFPAIWLQKLDMGDTWMQGDYEADFKFIKVIQYEEGTLKEAIQEGIKWVEDFIETKKQYLNNIYPWRNKEIDINS
ncbi:hypothetical protein BMG_6455 (plasmid) [Priestia megaterium]|uniref:hypothetical protein n=1 Tax=Priestia megaterium TaxID=1404 RepID=UPI0015DCF418|nr:hypothetical protein [Priestia megaterium]QLK09677.1 hypothetical protein BMG_6455 [Priestia megaterium]